MAEGRFAVRDAAALIIWLAAALAIPAAFAEDDAALAPAEQLAMSDTVQHALENNKTNAPSDWVNPDTGNSGGVTPVRTYENGSGQPCREFVSTIIIAGREQQGYGTACRQPDGTWRIVSSETAATEPAPPPREVITYVEVPPAEYFYYPADFYYPYHIYLSFSVVYRYGYVYRGMAYLDGPSFRHRYPFHVRERVLVTPRNPERYHRLEHWWQPRERGMVHHEYGRREPRGEWRYH